MVLTSKVKYNAPFKEIKEEGQIISLLEDVRNDLNIVYGVSEDIFDFKKLLKIVEEGKYKIVKKGITQLVDLSKAQALISQYRKKSEGGCQSCEEYSHFMPFQDFYCKIDEDPKELNFGRSPKILKFYEKGCEDRKPIFTKTIEEILK